ncbi:SIR2 family protein [Sorangium sp. So ce185]|uniref:SIR2 family protein n=1 Tax=Sorangium sp. So ce185 TaxID=3133287 RepID=UPI003F626821
MSAEADFLKTYVEALEQGTAAAFIGAGLSIAADFPDWRKLLRGLAGELGLDVDREHDLPAVAQFYLNRFANNRGRLAQLVRSTFRRPATPTENHRLLARLPLEHLWTTNYDDLLERAWELQGRRLDVKSRNADLTTSDPEAHAVLYKMHGTASQPDEIVLTTDDYERYRMNRPGFLQVLGSDLITRTFLFLGLSFTDPNLAYLMGTLRASFESVQRQHFTILKRPADDYDARRFDHFTTDLERYGVRTVVVHDYTDITRLLERIGRASAQRNVLVSGTYPDDGDAAERGFIEAVARGVGRVIARRGMNLVSGFGRSVGSGAIVGMLDEIKGRSDVPMSTLGRRLLLRPVPKAAPDGVELGEFRRRYREELIAQSGVVVVIGGLKDGAMSSGVLQEFEMAVAQRKLVLPIAATGHAARQIYERILARPKDYLAAEMDLGLFRRLGPEADTLDGIVAAVDACLAPIVNAAPVW